MFAALRKNFGNAAFVLPLMVLMGIIFNAELKDILLGTAIMYGSILVLLMLDDMFVVEPTNTGALMSEDELAEIDDLVTTKNQFIIRGIHVIRDVQSH